MGRISPISQPPLQVIIAQSLMYVVQWLEYVIWWKYDLRFTLFLLAQDQAPHWEKKRSKTSVNEASRPVVWGGKVWPFPPSQTTARLTSLADIHIFPISPRFLAFFHYCGALSIMSPLSYFLSPHFFSYGPMDPREWALTPTLPNPFQIE